MGGVRTTSPYASLWSPSTLSGTPPHTYNTYPHPTAPHIIRRFFIRLGVSERHSDRDSRAAGPSLRDGLA